MKKAKKIAIIVAVSMIAVGLIIMVGSMASKQFNMTEFNTMGWETKTYTVEESFTNIFLEITLFFPEPLFSLKTISKFIFPDF